MDSQNNGQLGWRLSWCGLVMGCLVVLFPSAGIAAERAPLLEQMALVAQGSASAEADQLLQQALLLVKEGSENSQRQAISVWEKAYKLYRAMGQRQKEAFSLWCIGTVYNFLGEKQRSLEYFNQALSLSRAAGERAVEAGTLNNIGLVYNDLGEKQQALEYYNQALPLSRALGDRAGEARTLNNIGAVYSDLGEKQQALDYFNQALLLRRALGDRALEATTLNNIGSVYDSLGEKQRALEYYNQALPLRRAVGDRAFEALTLNNIGAVYSGLGEKQRALEYYNQALLLSQAVGNRNSEAVTLNNIGRVYDSLGDKQQALEYYNRALLLSQAVGNRNGEAVTLNNIGKVYDSLSDKQQALKYYNRALPLIRAVGDLNSEATMLGNVASIHSDWRELEEAISQINAAIRIIENLRTKIGSDDLRTSYFATVQGFYQLKIGLLMQLKRDQEAFDTSEAARARVLLELLAESNVNIRRNVDPKLLAQETQQRQKLREIEQQRIKTLSGNHTAAQELDLDRRSNEALNDLDQTLAQIRSVSPAYADLKQPQPLTLAQIRQQVLDPNTVLVQYAIGKDRSYLWIVSAQEFTSYTLPGKATIQEAAQSFQSVVSNSGSPIDDVKRTGDALLPLILPELPQWTAGKRLLIVGDGILQQIPFAALPLPNQSEYVPLLTQHEILSQPSASAIAILRQQLKGRTPAPKAIAVLADPVYRPDDPRVTGKAPAFNLPIEIQRTLRTLDLQNTKRLPNTRTEAENILSLFPKGESTVAYDFDANYTWLTNPQLSQYRIVHLATHGFVNPVNPQLSGIVVSLVNPQGHTLNDGFLRLHDIFNLNLPAELVVLSACQTGLGEEVSGEGLVGLTRGLMYAGTKRIAVSLWNVNDAATAKLMNRFYQKMQDGLSPAAALRASQREAWQAKQRPYLWAAFSVQGEWQP